MDGSAFRGIGEAFILLLVVIAVSLPLALWKLAEIAVWLFQHISISWG